MSNTNTKGKDFTSDDLSYEMLEVTDIARAYQQIMAEIRKVYIGRTEIFEMLWIAMLTGKHVYLEGVPGIGKTYMANTFSLCLGTQFSRIQFTPDMLPSDIIGTNIFNPKTGTFRLRKGPIFGNVILADEVNRAPPKTQSAMLEAMGEGQVSIEGETHKLEKPFVVLATANPVEQEGTYPLPEAQLDRFMIKVVIHHSSPDDELRIIKFKNEPIPAIIKQVVSPQTIVAMMSVVKRVYVSPELLEMIRDITVSTRTDPRLVLGCSPRGSESLLLSGKARAAIHGRDFVIPDDIILMIPHIVHHRLILKPEAELEGITAIRISEDIRDSLTIPVDPIEEEMVYEEYIEEEEYEE
ncbi:MAG: AAA family ATPase [Candidatus Hodarchaeales archaeon]|jgi:MoxR-like ATPase